MTQLEPMIRNDLLDEILRLPPGDRLRLVEEIWDSLGASSESIPVPDWHRAELDRRLRNPDETADLSWDDVKARLRDPKK